MSDARPDWFGTPKAATSAVLMAVGRKGRGAVADLYERAHGLGYGPMAVTDRVLAEEWLLTRGEVWRVLEALDAAGLAKLEKAPPGARRPSVLTVFPPRLRAERSQTRSQNPSQNDEPPPPPMPEPEPEPEPEPARGPEPSRAEESRAQRPDETRQTSAVVADARARLLAMQEADSPELGMVAERDRGAVDRALPKHGEERLAALWAWSGVSEDPLVAGCRNGWRRWSSLLKSPQGDARIAAAWAWHEAGRPRPQATGPPRTRGSPDRGTPGDGFFDRMLERRQQPHPPDRDVIDAE